MKHNYLLDFIVDIQSKGRYTFSLSEIRSIFNRNNGAIKQALRRLVLQKKICPVRRNFYVIIPPEYLSQQILPAALFIDDLMKFIGKPYYVALLSAASFHGSSHQQPQEFFIISVKPALRKVTARGVVINFVTRREIDATFIMQKQTETGFLTVSCPALTALDCVSYHDRIGGIERAAEVIREMVPRLTKLEIQMLARGAFPVSMLQRLGFILDIFPEAKGIADTLYTAMNQKIKRSVSLVSEGEAPEKLPRSRWKIIVNRRLELDL